MSKNIAMIPLNPEGALELGRWPCSYCELGWGSYVQGKDGKTIVKSCRDECPYIKKAKEHLEDKLELKGKY